MTHLKVAVRVRPLSERELTLNSSSIIGISENTIDITNLKVPEQNAGDSRQRVRRFTFDHCFSPESTQDEVFNIIEAEIEKALINRYHSCVLAYGQSSTGKTHTMMGTTTEPGLIPKICDKIFDYLKKTASNENELETTAKVSYLEIYNEKVKDLLSPLKEDGKNQKLKVREHPKRGTYVQNLSEHEVTNSKSLLKLLYDGNSKRSVSSTLSNPYSSRSHSVFTLTYLDGLQLHLVDLAGSERAGSRCPTASVLKEGANINKSLVALGNVISNLADHSTKYSRFNNKRRFVPYRDSILTWLLKDTLGGNSRTIMIATVSPSSLCYSETVNTLRFGQRAKLIICQPIINEDPKEKTIRELRIEIEKLKQLLNQSKITSHLVEKIDAFTDSRDFDLTDRYFVESNKKTVDFSNATNPKDNELKSVTEESINEINTNDVSITPHSKPYISCSEIITTKSTSPTWYNEEKLIPVISVLTSIEKPDKFSRNTLLPSKMEKKKSKSLGSQELLNSTSSKSDKTKKPLLQKRTSDRFSSLAKSTLQKSQDNLLKQEKPNLNDARKIHRNDSKLDLLKKTNAPRKDIIASVTNRLYSSIKRKESIPEIQTQTSTSATTPLPLSPPPQPAAKEVPKEERTSNARVRLLEITRKALKAHRRRNVDIQTDFITTTRVKDVYTDVSDLQIQVTDIKEVATETEAKIYVDVGVCCSSVLDSFSQAATNTCLFLTRSCGTQSSEDLEGNVTEQKSLATSGSLSFTKYLQGKDGSNKNKTFTSLLNINVNENVNGKRLGDNNSEDSLDDLHQMQMCFPTPDLISNHNSLEIPTQASTTVNKMNEPTFTYLVNENFAVPTETYVANCTVATADIKDQIKSINLTTFYSPEICIGKTKSESAYPLKNKNPQPVNPNILEVENNLMTATVHSPEILKSIMKYGQKDNESVVGSSSFENLQKVRFSKSSLKIEKKVVDTMSKFLEEAAKLMTNLTRVANTLEANSNSCSSCDILVTVTESSDIPGSTRLKRKTTSERKQRKKHVSTISTQTWRNTENISIQTSDNESFYVPPNRFESILKESCDKLEHCINVALEKSNRKKVPSFERDELLHRFPQPFSCHPAEWNLKNLGNNVGIFEDSSLESNPTFSDYGSLPRQKISRRPTPSGSPSTYLKQLMRIRRQIVESSRDNLLQHINDDNF